MKNYFYGKKQKIIIRIISVIAVIILLIANIKRIIIFLNLNNNKLDFDTLNLSVLNLLSLVLFVLIFFYPEKYSLISLACFFYTIYIFWEETKNPMGILMFDLGTIILIFRGFFKKHKKIKILLLLFLLIMLSCCQLRFGYYTFLTTFIDTLGYSFVFFLGIFFAYGYASRNAPDEKILNIAKYEGLKESDIDLMYRVLNNLQYKVIAKELQKSEGTIRNRLNKIYDILGVADRVGFVTTFSGFELIYKPEIEVPETQVAENPDNF